MRYKLLGMGPPTLGYAIEDPYILGDTLYSQAASSASRRQQNYSLMEREGKKVLVDPVGNQYVETTQSNAIPADYTENLASDEEFALMVFLEMTDSSAQDVLDGWPLYAEHLSNGNITISGMSPGSNTVYEINRDDMQVYYWAMMDRNSDLSTAEMMNQGLLQFDRPQNSDLYRSFPWLNCRTHTCTTILPTKSPEPSKS